MPGQFPCLRLLLANRPLRLVLAHSFTALSHTFTTFPPCSHPRARRSRARSSVVFPQRVSRSERREKQASAPQGSAHMFQYLHATRATTPDESSQSRPANSTQLAARLSPDLSDVALERSKQPLTLPRRAETATSTPEDKSARKEQPGTIKRERQRARPRPNSRVTSRQMAQSIGSRAAMSSSKRPYGFTCSQISGVRARRSLGVSFPDHCDCASTCCNMRVLM